MKGRGGAKVVSRANIHHQYHFVGVERIKSVVTDRRARAVQSGCLPGGGADTIEVIPSLRLPSLCRLTRLGMARFAVFTSTYRVKSERQQRPTGDDNTPEYPFLAVIPLLPSDDS